RVRICRFLATKPEPLCLPKPSLRGLPPLQADIKPEAPKPRGKQTRRSLPLHAVCSFEGETASAGTSFALLRRDNLCSLWFPFYLRLAQREGSVPPAAK